MNLFQDLEMEVILLLVTVALVVITIPNVRLIYQVYHHLYDSNNQSKYFENFENIIMFL